MIRLSGFDRPLPVKKVNMRITKKVNVRSPSRSRWDINPKASRNERLTVLDLFCGAGGFSEGFRSVGCRIVAGIDHWRPAVETFNCNHALGGTPIDILSYEKNVQLIEELPNTDVIIGSPPCVSFSYSNKLGNADKTEGLRLMKVFFSIIAIKKFKRGSKLVAWYMENVANALDSLPNAYTFSELGLSRWAKTRGFCPTAVAIEIAGNAAILNAADFGVPQTRKRLFISEINKTVARRRKFGAKLVPLQTKVKAQMSAKAARTALPAPSCKSSSRKIRDPIYKSIEIPLKQITDHFYETGAYEIHWRDSKLLKISHPYMGKMSFPENEQKPSRTIVASPFPRSREALLYKSEWKRVGDGEYRGPTIREAATLMSFPISYQFIGSEGAKWKLVGNAVSPYVSRALAVQLLKTLKLKPYPTHRKALPVPLAELPNLNTFSTKTYDKPPQRKKLARFRSHPFKAASMTVALANYDVIAHGSAADGRWRCFVTYGIGEGYKVQAMNLGRLEEIRHVIQRSSPRGRAFVEHITNGFSEKIPSAALLQELYEKNLEEQERKLNPNRLLEETRKIVFKFLDERETSKTNSGFFLRDSVPRSQLYALFAICHIVSTTEAKQGRPDE